MGNEILTHLHDHWQRLTAHTPGAATLKNDCLRRLLAAYSEPQRVYHNQTHLLAVLEQLRVMNVHSPVADEVEFAAWYHDAVYDPKAADNEARSADWAVKELTLLGYTPDQIKTVERLILATKHSSQESPDLQTAQLLDSDLAVLGSTPEEYQIYAADIRKEYAFVPLADYRFGRAKVLQSFLTRPRIYLTDEMFTQREQLARQNLKEEIEGLRENTHLSEK